MRKRAVLSATLIAMLHAAPKIAHDEFGKLPDGTAVQIYTLTNSHGVVARITNYGGRLVEMRTPDRKGAMGDVVLGFDSVDGYVANPAPFFGAIIGRYANRIGGARFSIGDVEYHLEKNDGQNCLHSGSHGFDKAVWSARELQDGGLELTYVAKDGEGGFPGNLTTIVTYHLTNANELRIDYRASTDKPTVVNLTNHAYLNLKGSGDVLGHVLTLNADRFTPVDGALIPIGELRAVEETPFDFRKPAPIGERINQRDEQLSRGKGYDHNFVLNGAGLRLAARVEEPSTGRVLEVRTDQPGVQFYSGNFLDGTIQGRGGVAYVHRGGFCLETQHFPDSPNKPAFPTTLLNPGREFRSTTIYRFSAK